MGATSRRIACSVAALTMLAAGSIPAASAYWQLSSTSNTLPLLAGIVPPITVTFNNTFAGGNCTDSTATPMDLSTNTQANQTPFSLRWAQDTTGLIQGYQVTMTLSQDTGNLLAAVKSDGYAGWASNERPTLYVGAQWLTTSGTTYLPPGETTYQCNGTTAANPGPFTPTGMTGTTTATSTTTPNGMGAPTVPGNSTTWIIPSTITYAGGTTTVPSGCGLAGCSCANLTVPAQSSQPTVGVSWGASFASGSTLLNGTLTVWAIGPGGWLSTPVTIYWAEAYGSQTVGGVTGQQCSTQQIAGSTIP
ncbi:MAG: hypothetical protein FWG11_02500 [Promicromonosporaceae bacterium]|nr:hypothetical protein [Promicromonosporaceae bacterium]